MRLWIEKFKEVVISVSPITLLVVFLSLTIVRFEPAQLARFLIGAFLIVIGLTVFLVGVDQSITPFGNQMGSVIIRKNKLWIVAGAGLLLGFFISIAEPDLHILAGQVAVVTHSMIGKWNLVVIVSAGIALLIAVGLIRILYRFPLHILLTVLYGIILIFSLFASPEYLAIAFDSSGATTGAMTVPFILALALGLALKNKDGRASEKDSFGLVAIASSGAIIAVLISGLLMPNRDFAGTIDFSSEQSNSVFLPFFNQLLTQFTESIKAISPIFLILLISQPLFIKMEWKTFIKMSRGFLYTLIGLTLMFAGVHAGFMEVGREIGSQLVLLENKSILVIVGFALGFLTILAEPAVHVLTEEIESVTGGSVRRKAVMLALAIGVGIAVALSVLRILIPQLQLWHILLPGYVIAILLAHFGSKRFVGIAFDSGGVASGPMTATFILAYTQGAANSLQSASILVDGFGVIALVALTPIVSLQIMGLVYRRKS
ncbi:MAG: DUF1538 domain-containing protein [Clostridiaceae bacterium]|nr:DUF1538 domain-containing protein [Clostridiaceae bacterium]